MENEELKELFRKKFQREPEYYFDAGGRLEILGNHTDHNHGLCLVANCSLRIKAYVAKTEKKIKVKSQGYQYISFDIDDLEKFNKKVRSTNFLLRGILIRLKQLGYKIGGFTAYIDSDIPDGSGVSSSAAIESLFGFIISYLYNDGKIDNLTIAKVGQYSENNFFLKPCGLLDQIGTSFPNMNFIDFKNIENPHLENIVFNLPLDLYLVKSEGDHANLTPLYARIPTSMKKAAISLSNKEFLADIEYRENLFDRIDNLNLSEYEKKAAKHFYIECNNVLKGKEALLNNDLESFLSAVRLSQQTSKNNIQNTYVKEDPFLNSPQDIIDKLTIFLKDKGAVRIHGGGFKGTVLAFVKKEFSIEFENFLNLVYKDRWYKVDISKNEINYKKLV